MNLNLACGDLKLGEDIGVDIYHSSAVDVMANVSSLPFKDASIENIQCRQAVEHFFPDETIPLFVEWARVLKRGGNLFITTPDFRYVAEQFVHHGMQIHIARAYICGTTEFNTYKKDEPESYHRTLWDESSLRGELSVCGFGNFNAWNEEWNLNLNAQKL